MSLKIGYAEFCVRVGDPLAGREAGAFHRPVTDEYGRYPEAVGLFVRDAPGLEQVPQQLGVFDAAASTERRPVAINAAFVTEGRQDTTRRQLRLALHVSVDLDESARLLAS